MDDLCSRGSSAGGLIGLGIALLNHDSPHRTPLLEHCIERAIVHLSHIGTEGIAPSLSLAR